MTRLVERLALVGSLSVLSVAVLTGAKSVGRSLADARIEELTIRLDAMERRLAAVERGVVTSAPLGTTVKAPFVVTDANNVPIMSVKSDPRGFEITNAGKTVVVSAETFTDGASLTVKDVNSSRSGVLWAHNGFASLELQDSPNSSRIELSIPKTGPAQMMVKNQSHSLAAWIGHGSVGGGQLKLSDDSSHVMVEVGAIPGGGGVVKAYNKDDSREAVLGVKGQSAAFELRDGPAKLRASLSIPSDGSSALILTNKAHINVLTLAQGARGDGALQLMTAAGAVNVEAGTLPEGVGIVRAGPRFKCTGFGGLIASDCIKGHP